MYTVIINLSVFTTCLKNTKSKEININLYTSSNVFKKNQASVETPNTFISRTKYSHTKYIIICNIQYALYITWNEIPLSIETTVTSKKDLVIRKRSSLCSPIEWKTAKAFFNQFYLIFFLFKHPANVCEALIQRE